MKINEIEVFVESKRKFIREFFEKNQEELTNRIDINSIDDAYKVMLQLTDKNLDIIVKLKSDLENSGNEQEKLELEDMIKTMMQTVTDGLAVYP